MRLYRIYLAVLCGAALTVVFRTMVGATSRLGAAGLWPGESVGRLAFGTPVPGWAVLAGNVAVYSLLGGLVVSRLTRKKSVADLRQLAAFATLLLPVFLVSAFAGTWALERKGLGECRNAGVASVDAPDTQRKAVVFLRECGAGADFSTHVAVWQASVRMNHADLGNALIVARGGAGDATRGQAVEVGLQWESAAGLVVSYPASANVVVRESSVEGVSVRYETVPAKASGSHQ